MMLRVLMAQRCVPSLPLRTSIHDVRFPSETATGASRIGSAQHYMQQTVDTLFLPAARDPRQQPEACPAAANAATATTAPLPASPCPASLVPLPSRRLFPAEPTRVVATVSLSA